jgi:hypothetical protein
MQLSEIVGHPVPEFDVQMWEASAVKTLCFSLIKPSNVDSSLLAWFMEDPTKLMGLERMRK